MDRHLEIERKFLVKGRRVGWRRRPSSRIVQGYFPVASKELEIRVRRKGAEHAITIKSGSGRSRLEEEIKIQPSHFLTFWAFACATGPAAKGNHRYENATTAGDTGFSLWVQRN